MGRPFFMDLGREGPVYETTCGGCMVVAKIARVASLPFAFEYKG